MRQEAAVIVLVVLVLACTLAFGLGLALAGGTDVSPEYRKAMESLHLDTATRMGWIKIGFWGGLVVLSLVGLGGLVGGLLRVVWRRSRLVHPQPSGIFPVIEGRAGGQTYYHDPNRQLAGTVAYGDGPDGVAVRHLVPSGQEGAQFQIATQAQATQFVAAASQGQKLTAQAGRLVERMAAAASAPPVPRLPEVVVLDGAVPEERRLLAALRQDWEEGG